MSVSSAIDAAAAAAIDRLSPSARRFRALAVAAGLAVFVVTILQWSSPDIIKYLIFLVVALAVSFTTIQAPAGRGAWPISVVVVLYGVADLSEAETVFLAAACALLPRLWNRELRGNEGVLFPAATAVVGVVAAERVYHSSMQGAQLLDPAVMMVIAGLTLFLFETGAQAGMAAMDQRRTFATLWYRHYFWTLPFYLGGAVVARLMAVGSQMVGWQTVLLTCPVIYLIFRSYRLYLHRLEDGKRHAEEMASLHMRTIEALALAIEAKDDTTGDHLQRVQVYAQQMADALGLSHQELQALRAAAVLHDIGKLAVPEHIISKPGRLTPEEFDKMKIHPTVGAEILERVRFPYPVAPIVRAHHEKWDGSGYPAGLRGEAIPIGARILAAVDCLDALASDRQYRRALPLSEAMRVVQDEAGKAFDPKIVEILSQHYVEWEQRAQLPAAKHAKLSKEVKVERGDAPAAGFEETSPSVSESSEDAPQEFLTSIAAARTEVQTLFEIAQDLGNSLALDETLSVLNVRLRKIIPHHSLAIWLRRGVMLDPGYVNGEDYRLFSSLNIPVGQGLSGWVAENGRPIVNGNPKVETAHLNNAEICSTLKSAVAVPLEDGTGGVVGVITLYHTDRDAFSKDHLRILQAISTKIGVAVDNALRFRQVESSATTDFMTELPNARSLFLQLDAEISRARRGEQPLSVVVLDMDGLKLINDRFGHLEGNRVLGAVASGLKHACREYDYVARMGGDEFVMLIPGMRGPDTQTRIDHLRLVVADAGVGLFNDRDLSASIGVASFPDDGKDAETLLAEADRRMYQEKRLRKESRQQIPQHDWASQLASLHQEP